MASVDEKVRKLIALAIDRAASENEARNAALQAVKLIAEHGLLGNVRARPPEDFRDRNALIHEIRLLQSHLRGAEINEKMLKGTIAVLERKIQMLEHGRSSEVRDARDTTDRRYRAIIVSKFSGRCAYCREPYEVGDHIAWARGRTTFHSDCYDDWLEESA